MGVNPKTLSDRIGHADSRVLATALPQHRVVEGLHAAGQFRAAQIREQFELVHGERAGIAFEARSWCPG
jgi:hypothetical protein